MCVLGLLLDIVVYVAVLDSKSHGFVPQALSTNFGTTHSVRGTAGIPNIPQTSPTLPTKSPKNNICDTIFGTLLWIWLWWYYRVGLGMR